MGEVLLEESGSVIPDQARRLCRWEEHFREILKHAAVPNTPPPSPTYIPAVEQYPRKANPPSSEEVCLAIRQLRNSTAPEEAGIPAEIYKTCLDSPGLWLHLVISKVWSGETAPSKWSRAVHLPLFKKGDKRIYFNYRGIGLTSVVLKQFQSERD